MPTPPNYIPVDAREIYVDEQTGEPIAYCPVDSLGITDLERAQFWSMQDHARFRELAIRARKRSNTSEQAFAVVCIDVDDATWRPVVDGLMPNYDWQAYRDRGERPVARGVVPKHFVAELLASFYPAAGEMDPTAISIVVFAAGGAAIHIAEGV